MNSNANIARELANDKTSQHVISHTTSYRVSSRSEIVSLLNKLASNHVLLSIIVSDYPKTFGSMILEINQKKKYLVFDELYPRKEIRESLLGSSLAIETQLDGIDLHFKVKVQAIAEKDGIEYYKTSYPGIVYHHQRRSSYRVNVSVTEPIAVKLSTENDVLVHAELRDISQGGVNARINTPLAESLMVGDEIPTCIIQTPDGKKIVSSLEIARVEEAENKQPMRIGARFIHINSQDRNELSRLIAKLDRDNIKKLKRLSSDD